MLTFRKNILPPSSGSKMEAGGSRFIQYGTHIPYHNTSHSRWQYST